MTQDSQLEARRAAESVANAARGADSFDDMHDSAEEIKRYSALARPLEQCRPIADEFDAADTRAVRYQRFHRWLTRGAAIFGALAVVFAIVGLSRGHQEL